MGHSFRIIKLNLDYEAMDNGQLIKAGVVFWEGRDTLSYAHMLMCAHTYIEGTPSGKRVTICYIVHDFRHSQIS